MYAHSKTLDICVGEVKSKCDDVEKETKELAIKLEKIKEIQAITEELKSLQNKVKGLYKIECLRVDTFLKKFII